MLWMDLFGKKEQRIPTNVELVSQKTWKLPCASMARAILLPSLCKQLSLLRESIYDVTVSASLILYILLIT